jgi:cytidine deaminase
MMASRGCSRDELLQSMVMPSSALARPPISNFNVGAVGMTPNGDVYVGVNLEFLGMPLNNSVHAEQFLVANLRLHKETELELMAVNAAPCGHCRQFLSELACASTLQILLPGPKASRRSSRTGDAPSQYSLADLLPMRFCPQDLLGDCPPPLLLQEQKLHLQFTADFCANPRYAPWVDGHGSAQSTALYKALEQARESFAPYSNCPAGVAIVTRSEQVYAGAYLESCAFNPGMQALQVALVDAAIHGLPRYTDIALVLVAEVPGSQVQHAPMIRLLLQSIAPVAEVIDVHLTRG